MVKHIDYSIISSRRSINLPPKIAQDCYREAIAIAKSWLNNPNRGNIPRAKTLRICLTHKYSYRINGNYVELLGGSYLNHRNTLQEGVLAVDVNEKHIVIGNSMLEYRFKPLLRRH
ncbi:MAG: hypothetical protein QXE10_02620 [Desulfurococcaceae archaeon]